MKFGSQFLDVMILRLRSKLSRLLLTHCVSCLFIHLGGPLRYLFGRCSFDTGEMISSFTHQSFPLMVNHLRVEGIGLRTDSLLLS